MRRFQLEPNLFAHAFGDLVHQGAWQIEHSPALMTERVKVRDVLRRPEQMIGRSAVAEVHMSHDTHLRQCLEGAVHRRSMDSGVVLGDRRREVLGCGVSPLGGEGFDHHAPRRRHAMSAAPDLLERLLGYRGASGPRVLLAE